MTLLRIGGAADAQGRKFFSSNKLTETSGGLYFDGNRLLVEGEATITVKSASATLGQAVSIKAGSNVTFTFSNGELTISAPAGGDTNVIETVKVNNSALPVTGKAVNIDLSGYAASSTVTSHTGNAAIHVPSTGTTGYYLKKTASGTEWAEVPQGSTITVDESLSPTSTNPVQNKAIYAVIGNVESQLSAI